MGTQKVIYLAAAALLPLTAAGAAPEAKDGASDRLVCKYRAKTGTRFASKTCRTVAQWDEIAEDSRRNMKDIVDRPQISACGPSGCD